MYCHKKVSTCVLKTKVRSIKYISPGMLPYNDKFNYNPDYMTLIINNMELSPIEKIDFLQYYCTTMNNKHLNDNTKINMCMTKHNEITKKYKPNAKLTLLDNINEHPLKDILLNYYNNLKGSRMKEKKELSG